MHWTNLITIISLILTNTSLICARTTARVWTKFYPHCPPTAPSRVGDLKLDEQFGTGMNIHADTCQPVPVPLGYGPEVDHVSLDTDAFWKKPGEKCTIALHELPGCVDPPLIKTEIERGDVRPVESECKKRRIAAFNEVWVNFQCGDERVNQVSPPKLHQQNKFRNETDAPVNGTLPGRLWQRRRTRLSFL